MRTSPRRRRRPTTPPPRSPPPTTSSNRRATDIANLKQSIAVDQGARRRSSALSPASARVFAYTHPGNSLETLVDSKGTVDAARRQHLLDQANQTDNDVVKRLAAVNDQLKSQQADLEQQEHEQQAISDQLDVKLTALQAKQAES